MRVIDSHCHLDFTELRPWLQTSLAQARAAGVDTWLVPGVTAATWQSLLEFCQQQPGAYPALGLHPYFIAEHRPQDVVWLAQLLKQQAPLAVGEIGLDKCIEPLHWQWQLQLCEQQLRLAEQAGLPVILHVRKAHQEMQALLKQVGFSHGGIVHAFSGSAEQAEPYLRRGFKLGVGGALTYPRAQRLHRLVKALPDAWVLETDAPSMPLMGYQGKPNLPHRILEVLQHIAQLWQLSPEQAAARLTAQTLQVLPGLAAAKTAC